MQKRRFGKTNLETSLLGFGGFHLLEIPYSETEYLLNSYLDAGGNYIETAASYGDGESELKIGKAVRHRRNSFVLATKTGERNKEGFLKSLDRSLKNLQTDCVDIIIMHGVGTLNELETILGPNGAMEGYYQARQEGKVSWVGISMHGQPDILMKGLQRHPFDAVMTTINYFDRFNFPEIESELLPLALHKGAAVILMKPIADGLLWRSAAKAFQYAFSRPVSVVVSGINHRDMLKNDLFYAEQYVPITAEEEEQIFKIAPELRNYVCRQCGKCLPCPEGIPVNEIFKYEGYFDRQLADGTVKDPAEYALRERLRFWFGNRELAMEKYKNLAIKADRCNGCGVCMPRCPYGIDIVYKLGISDYKLAGKKIF